MKKHKIEPDEKYLQEFKETVPPKLSPPIIPNAKTITETKTIELNEEELTEVVDSLELLK